MHTNWNGILRYLFPYFVKDFVCCCVLQENVNRFNNWDQKNIADAQFLRTIRFCLASTFIYKKKGQWYCKCLWTHTDIPDVSSPWIILIKCSGRSLLNFQNSPEKDFLIILQAILENPERPILFPWLYRNLLFQIVNTLFTEICVLQQNKINHNFMIIVFL